MKLKKLSKTAMALVLVCAMAFNASTVFAAEKTESGISGGQSFKGYLKATTTSAIARTFSATGANFAYLEVQLTVWVRIDGVEKKLPLHTNYTTDYNTVGIEVSTSASQPITKASSKHAARYLSGSGTGSFELSVTP